MELKKQKGKARAEVYALMCRGEQRCLRQVRTFCFNTGLWSPNMPLILVLGPALDLLFIALLSRHRTFWLALAATVACGLSLFGDLAGNGVTNPAPLLGGSR
jgi:hypothetical protein